jgi:hypothetical protein
MIKRKRLIGTGIEIFEMFLFISMNGTNYCFIGFGPIKRERINRLFQSLITGKHTEI